MAAQRCRAPAGCPSTRVSSYYRVTLAAFLTPPPWFPLLHSSHDSHTGPFTGGRGEGDIRKSEGWVRVTSTLLSRLLTESISQGPMLAATQFLPGAGGSLDVAQGRVVWGRGGGALGGRGCDGADPLTLGSAGRRS